MAESQLSKTADLRDEHGNPIQLTDEHGNPVQLTDEYGHPMHLTGVAAAVTGVGVPGGPAEIEVPASGPVEVASSEPALKHGDVPPETGGIMGSPEDDHRKVDRTGSSSGSSSSEEDGQGGRRKKKGLKEKIKEKLSGGKHRENKELEHVSQPTTHTSETPPPPPPLGEHHEKKSVMEKIKEKLPGHHSHS